MKIKHYIIGLCLSFGILVAEKAQGQELKPIFSEERLSKDTSTAGIDGPYVYYRKHGEQQEIKAVTEKNGKIEVTAKLYEGKRKRAKKLKVQVDKNQYFSLRLKEKLTNESAVYPMPEKLIAISDIEGEFEVFRSFLIANGVMNEKYKWTFGKGHLVTVGDFFDRGLMVTQTLWLIYHLENQAEKAGGKVHFILGNHDLMNMNNDFRYVRKKYLANAELMNFPYIDFYKPYTELGRWLSTKNIVEKIGDYVFVHAGISKEVSDLNLSVQELNNNARRYYFENKKAQKLQDNVCSTIYKFGVSPMWYRGWGKQTITPEEADEIMGRWNVGKFVIGHSLHSEVTYLMNKRVIDLDVQHAKGVIQGLLIEGGNEYKVDNKGEKTTIVENASIPEDDD